MSKPLDERVKKILGMREVCFNVKRTSVELIIDHKFPSQRWNTPEEPNLETMSEIDIKKKFQLLNNQTNMLKSRYCDKCVQTGIRGDFMGTSWFYQGTAMWDNPNQNAEEGCVGCPWYDLEKWKFELKKKITE